MNESGLLQQQAPYPEILASLVERLSYRKGWSFELRDIDRGQGSEGLTFMVLGTYPNTYRPDEQIRVYHYYFPVPPAAYDERSWRRWLFDRLLEVERHEAMEFFQIDGERPYAPHHGPGNDPYIVFEHGTRRRRADLVPRRAQPAVNRWARSESARSRRCARPVSHMRSGRGGSGRLPTPRGADAQWSRRPARSATTRSGSAVTTR